MGRSAALFRKSVLRRIVAKVAAESFLIVGVLFLLVCFVGYHVDAYLTHTLELAVSRQVDTVAHSVGQQLNQEMIQTEHSAWLISQGRVHPEEMVEAVNHWTNRQLPRGNIQTGVISQDDTVIAGSRPHGKKDLKLDRRIYDGESAIAYWEDRGLMFAAPVFDQEGDTLVAAFYKLYDNAALLEQFNLRLFDGEGVVALFDETGLLGMLTKGGEGSESQHIDMNTFYARPEWQREYRAVWQDVREQGRVAHFFETEGGCFFAFGAEIPHTDLKLMGYVPWDAVAGGLDHVYMAMLITFGILLSGVLMFSRYVFMARVKAQENRELEEAKTRADAANRAKGEFLSNMSHEIRTPINAVLGMDEMILRESREEAILGYAENIRVAGVSLLGLVNDILDFSKIEAGKMDIIPVEYAVGSLLGDLVNMIEMRAEKKGLALQVEADKSLPGILLGDEIRIKQIVTNLLTNAVKYTETGSVILAVAYDKLDDSRISLKVAVKDTGIGIKEQDIAKLFMAFERIEEQRNRSIEGTGLGMNITERLLFLMGSRLEVSSVYGEGSTFSFALEQKVSDWNPMGDFAFGHRRSSTHRQAYREQFTAPNAKILVVDDTAMNLAVVKGLLKQTKVQIMTADSGYECLRLTEKEPYDMIFLDHRMPGLDGIETLQRIREQEGNQNADTPVIALTANALSGAKEKYLQAGFTDYLTKPILGANLEALMIKYLPTEKLCLAETHEQIPMDVPVPEGLPSWMKEIDGLDTMAGTAHCGSAEAYWEAVKVFAESIASGAAEIEAYFNAADWQNYTTKVHALKSSARVIGATELSEKARRLEEAGNNGNIEEIERDTPKMLSLYRAYEGKFSPLRRKAVADTDVKKTMITSAELADAYETLVGFAASFDYDGLRFVLDSLSAYQMPKKDAQRFEALEKAANKLDWDEVRRILGEVHF